MSPRRFSLKIILEAVVASLVGQPWHSGGCSITSATSLKPQLFLAGALATALKVTRLQIGFTSHCLEVAVELSVMMSTLPDANSRKQSSLSYS